MKITSNEDTYDVYMANGMEYRDPADPRDSYAYRHCRHCRFSFAMYGARRFRPYITTQDPINPIGKVLPPVGICIAIACHWPDRKAQLPRQNIKMRNPGYDRPIVPFNELVQYYTTINTHTIALCKLQNRKDSVK